MSKALLVLIVSLFLVLIGIGISKRTQLSVAPPIYDPVGYYLRAQLVWSAIAKGDFHGILTGPMDVRPPGTALILYPFGFKVSVHRFLFRSLFVPILIWSIALSIPIATKVNSRWDGLLGSSLVVGLATMPLFYQFELNEMFTKAYNNVINQWGMVDPLEGAIAALAISLLRFGIANRKLRWYAAGWFAGAFSYFVKPSGILVMMTLVGVAGVELLILFFSSQLRGRTMAKFVAAVYATGFSIMGIALWLALASGYMSHEVITHAIRASQILISVNQGRQLFAILALFVVPIVGWWWFCPGLFFTGLTIFEIAEAIAKRQWSSVGARLVAAGIIWCAAICWWIFLAGQDPRYLFPFLLMVMVWFVPEVFQRVLELGRVAKKTVICYCLAPAVLLVGLLWSKDPPIIFQQLMGVNLSAGGYGPEVKLGQWLFAQSEKLGRPLNLYSLGAFSAGVVEMIDWVESIEKKELPGRFHVARPLNWIDAPGLRVEELIHSDFLLLENVRTVDAGKTPVLTWSEEVERFKQFAYSESGLDKNGLVLVSDGTVKLLRVDDAHRFSATLFAWASSVHWMDDFRDRNKAFLENPPK
jgi:hypothetical protein